MDYKCHGAAHLLRWTMGLVVSFFTSARESMKWVCGWSHKQRPLLGENHFGQAIPLENTTLLSPPTDWTTAMLLQT